MTKTSERTESLPDLDVLSLRSVRDGDTHIVALAGGLDRSAAARVEGELKRVERTDARFIVLDLRDLEFVDARGVRVFASACRRAPDRLILVEVPRCVRRIFESCETSSRLPMPMYLSVGRQVTVIAVKQCP